MKICVLGESHLAHYTRVGAAYRKLHVTNDPAEADLMIVAQDVVTDQRGTRYFSAIVDMLEAVKSMDKPILLMSQVPPGFCRAQNCDRLYHYPETLRIKDSYERACNPEYIIIGCYDRVSGIQHAEVMEYAGAFSCPVRVMRYESAEMAKIAVNTHLAMQVEYANRMADACTAVGANWDQIAAAIKHDKRIGPHAYLTPGRWQDSLHLLRDSVTLKQIEAGDGFSGESNE